MCYYVHMIVYRYLSEKELLLIKQGKIDEIGTYYTKENFKKVNTHNYKIGVKYLHFFKTYNSKMFNQIRYLHKGDGQDYYICEFNIPLKNLIFCAGLGHYKFSGHQQKCTVLEFAMEANKLKKEWLTAYEFDKHKQIIEKMK